MSPLTRNIRPIVSMCVNHIIFINILFDVMSIQSECNAVTSNSVCFMSICLYNLSVIASAWVQALFMGFMLLIFLIFCAMGFVLVAFVLCLVPIVACLTWLPIFDCPFGFLQRLLNPSWYVFVSLLLIFQFKAKINYSSKTSEVWL